MQTHHTLTVFRAFLLLFFCAGAQVMAQSPAVANASLNDSLLQGAHSIILNEEITYEVHSPRSVTQREERSVMILDKRHQHEQTVYAWYDNESKVTDFEVRVTDLLGNQTSRVRRSDVQDERYTSDGTFVDDTYVKYVEVQCESYPCIVTSIIERKLTDFSATLRTPRWFPVHYDQALLQATYTAHVPLDNNILFDTQGIGEPNIETSGKRKTYTWKLSNVNAQCAEPLGPAYTEVMPHLFITLENFRIDEYSGSYRDWNSFGHFINDIMDGRDVLPEALAVEVHETVAGATTRRDTIDRLYRLMQKRCRYVSIQLGIGGWQPFPADFVEENRYGDCKALSNYMGAMLKEVGIESYPVLIYRDDRPRYDVREDYAISSFNHMVLYVPSEDMYLECTSTDEPTGYLSDDKEDRNVVWITPEGGRLVRTPKLEPGDHGHVRTVRLRLREDNSVGFSLEGSWFGADQETFRSVGSYFGDGKDQRKWLHRNDFLPDVSGGEYTFDVHRDEPVVDLHYETVLPHRVRAFGSRRFVSVNPFPRNWVPDPVEDRQLPVVYSDPRMLVDTVHLHYPNGLEIESGLLSEPVVYEHPVGEYRAEMRAGENSVTWIRTLRLNSVTLPAEDYEDFRQFFIDLGKAEGLQLVLKEQRTK